MAHYQPARAGKSRHVHAIQVVKILLSAGKGRQEPAVSSMPTPEPSWSQYDPLFFSSGLLAANATSVLAAGWLHWRERGAHAPWHEWGAHAPWHEWGPQAPSGFRSSCGRLWVWLLSRWGFFGDLPGGLHGKRCENISLPFYYILLHPAT